jgi:hypothetical protein
MKISKRLAQDRGRMLRRSKNDAVWELRYVVFGEEDELLIYAEGDLSEHFAKRYAEGQLRKLFRARKSDILFISATLTR